MCQHCIDKGIMTQEDWNNRYSAMNEQVHIKWHELEKFYEGIIDEVTVNSVIQFLAHYTLDKGINVFDVLQAMQTSMNAVIFERMRKSASSEPNNTEDKPIYVQPSVADAKRKH